MLLNFSQNHHRHDRIDAIDLHEKPALIVRRRKKTAHIEPRKVQYAARDSIIKETVFDFIAQKVKARFAAVFLLTYISSQLPTSSFSFGAPEK